MAVGQEVVGGEEAGAEGDGVHAEVGVGVVLYGAASIVHNTVKTALQRTVIRRGHGCIFAAHPHTPHQR